MRFAVNSSLLQFHIIDHIIDAKVRGKSTLFEMGSGGQVGVFRVEVSKNRCNFDLSLGQINAKKACIKPSFSFLVIDTTVAQENSLRFRKNLEENIKTNQNRINDEKLQ